MQDVRSHDDRIAGIDYARDRLFFGDPSLDCGTLQDPVPVRAAHDVKQPLASSAASMCSLIVTICSRTQQGGCTWCTPSLNDQGLHPGISRRALSATVLSWCHATDQLVLAGLSK
jgi:hypothetical protein